MVTELRARAGLRDIGIAVAAVAALTFFPAELAAQSPSVTATPTTVAPGGTITVTVANGPGSPTDWVALAPTTAPDTTYLDWKYLNDSTIPPGAGLTSATVHLTAPSTSGTYEVRFFANFGFTRLATSSPITVQAGLPTLSINNVSTTEGNSGTTPATFTVTLSPTSTQTVTVSYATANGTATAGSDYVSKSGTLTFTSGTATQPLTVLVNGDTTSEPNETFVVTLSSPTNAVLGTAQGTGTIVNDEGTPTPTITASPTAVAPGGTITVVVANGPGNLTDWVALAATGSPATSFVAWKYLGGGTGGTLQFVAPATPGTYEARFLANDGYVVLATSNPVTVQSQPTLSINTVSALEGNSGTTPFTFTVSLSPTSTQTVTVAYATANGTATAGSDYVAAIGTLTFAPGVSTQPLAVLVNGDTTAEPNETFVVTLSSPTNAVLGTAQGVGTILNDEAAPTPTVTASPTAVAPGGTITVVVANGPGNPADWVALAATGSPVTSSVAWKYVGGGTGATLQFVAPTTPGTYEARLLANDGYVLLATSNPVTVQSQPTLSINNVRLSEGNSGTAPFTLTVSLSPTSTQTVTVAYATANGTATAGSDYVAASGTLTFAPGAATQTLAVSINGDTTAEPDETFFVNLSSATNAVLGSAQGVGTILNDEAAPTPTVTASPTAVAPGGTITVVVANGPGNPADWVALAATGSPVTSSVAWKYLGGGTGGTLQFVAPTTPGTYEARLLANDGYVLLATSNPVTVNDTTPPLISSVTASSITASAATITWTTDKASDSQVDYGPTTAYGSTSALNSNLVTSHSITLSGLGSTTLYHFRVRSRDAAGNLATSSDFTLTTLDGTAPTVSLTAPAANATVSNSITISATAADNVGVSGVQFRLDGAVLGAEDTTSPYSVSWNTTGTSNGSHSLSAVARDAAGNKTTSAAVTVTVSNDITPPVISAVSASSMTATGATIGWSTDETSDSQVDYGVTTAYGSSNALNASLVTAHTMSLSGLTANTLYHYRVRSRDAAGNLALSGDFSFTTLAGDTTLPTVAISAPTGGSTVSGVATVSANASDNVGVAGVQFRLDGAALGAEDMAAPYSISWDTTTATPGSHTLTAVARDAANNQTTSAAVSVTVATPTANLVAAYAYNEGAGTTAADGSVNNNTATVSGTTWSTACQFGTCLAFNGTSSFVDAPDLDVLTPGTEATFEAWVVLAATPTETVSVFNKWNQTGDDEYLFGIDLTRTLYFAWHTTGAGTWPSVSFNDAVGTGTLPLNTLTHIAVVRSGGTVTFYINGTLDSSLTVMDTNPFRNGINTLRIGGQARGAKNRFFDGRIDEARLYNRALTQSEIQTDMTTTIGPDTTPPVLSTITVSAVTSSGATISWTTNEASDSQVEYGATTAYGQATPLNSGLVTAHMAILGSLTQNTIYHYRVRSRDAGGNLALSGDATFTTLVLDLTPPTVSLTAPAANATVAGIVTVSGQATDNVGVVGVQFKLDGVALGLEDTVAPYTIAWDTTTASPGPHTLTAVAWDASGNQRTSTAVAVTVSNPQVKLAWNANTETDLAGYTVYVGEASGVYSTIFEVGNITTFTVPSLLPAHLYYFAVTASNQSGNESAFSNEVSTTTP
jgi:hypothetical protein